MARRSPSARVSRSALAGRRRLWCGYRRKASPPYQSALAPEQRQPTARGAEAAGAQNAPSEAEFLRILWAAAALQWSCLLYQPSRRMFSPMRRSLLPRRLTARLDHAAQFPRPFLSLCLIFPPRRAGRCQLPVYRAPAARIIQYIHGEATHFVPSHPRGRLASVPEPSLTGHGARDKMPLKRNPARYWPGIRAAQTAMPLCRVDAAKAGASSLAFLFLRVTLCALPCAARLSERADWAHRSRGSSP